MYFPLCTSVTSGFYRCVNLTSADLPKCTYVGNGVFAGCSNVSIVNIPECQILGDLAFNSCISLQTMSIPKCSSIGKSAFYYCNNLSQLYIGTSNCTLANTAAFNSTPFSRSTYLGYFGSIYVPLEYLSWYQSATN